MIQQALTHASYYKSLIPDSNLPEEPEKASGLLTILAPTLLPQPRPSGLAKGQFTVPEDFNTPLPEDVFQAFEGK